MRRRATSSSRGAMSRPFRTCVRSGGAATSARDLGNPVLEVVVVGDPGDAAVADLEECPAGQHVLLAAGLGKAGVAGLVGAVHHVLGRRAGAVGGSHDGDVAQLLRVARIHARQEGAESVAPGFARALVEVVGDVVGEQREHALPVGPVEGVVVGPDERGGFHAAKYTPLQYPGPGYRAPRGPSGSTATPRGVPAGRPYAAAAT